MRQLPLDVVSAGMLLRRSAGAINNTTSTSAEFAEAADLAEPAEPFGCQPAPPAALEASLDSGQIRVGSAPGHEKADKLAPTAVITA